MAYFHQSIQAAENHEYLMGARGTPNLNAARMYDCHYYIIVTGG